MTQTSVLVIFFFVIFNAIRKTPDNWDGGCFMQFKATDNCGNTPHTHHPRIDGLVPSALTVQNPKNGISQ